MSAMVCCCSRWRWQVFDSEFELDVEHRGQGVGLDRHMLFEPGHFIHRRSAPINEVISAASNADLFGAGPIGLEALVGTIAALGGLDPDELDAAVLHRVPVDIPLIFRDVDPLDRIVPRFGQIEVEFGLPFDIFGDAAGGAACQDRGERRDEAETREGAKRRHIQPYL